MTALANRSLLLIISGGIAAYKSLELIRRLKDNGARVRCILTSGGAQFITPLAVSALSGQPVCTDMFATEQTMNHIQLSREADLVIIAPASANMMAKMAHGMADSLAAAALLANKKPVLIAPAMNSAMWSHPATQMNLVTLQRRGVKVIGPASGDLACGEQGAGRMVEPAEILQAILDFFKSNLPLSGKKALVTSGPTFEPLDPVRFLGNRSSGKQGHAIASALAALGADLTLVSGPTALPDPAGVTTHHIETAREMLAACQQSGPQDIVVCAAAVADWCVDNVANEKIKKTSGASPTLTLAENPDILATLAAPSATRAKLVIGFAAETDHVTTYATEKFRRKGCDWLLANQVGAGKGFGTEDNQITLLTRTPTGEIKSEEWPAASKKEIAAQLAAKIASFFSV